MEGLDKITFTCPNCNKTYKTDVKYAGMSFTCNGCSQNMTIPLLAVPLQEISTGGEKKLSEIQR